MTPTDHDDDDLITARLADLSRRQRLMYRLEHMDASDPDYDLENMQVARYDWTPGKHWLAPAPKRSGV